MPTLVTLDEFKAHIGDTSRMDFTSAGDADQYLTDLLDRTEDMLERETNQTFHAAGTATEEPHNGTGQKWVWVDKEISTLTEVKIGFDPNDPDTTLSTVPDEIQAVNDRKIVRRDTGFFPHGQSNVYVTYDHPAFEPRVAEQALLEGAAFLLRRKGSEHVASQTIGQLGQQQYAALYSKLPAWSKAVDQLKRRAAVFC